MTKRKLYLLLQAAVCTALAALLCLAAVGIWREGSVRKAADPTESVYTPEAVAEKLASIEPLAFAGLGLLAAGLVLGVKDNGAEEPAKENAVPAPARPSKRTGAVRAALIAAAVALIVAGALNGSARDVLYKAITICTECVGLG